MDGELRQLFRQNIRGGFFQAIESGGVGSGIADVFYCLRGVSGWIECKRTSANAVVISPFQTSWAEALHRAGGNTFFAVRQHAPAGKRRLACDNLWMIHACGGRGLLDGGLSAVVPQYILGQWPGGPSKWDWLEVEKILTTKPAKHGSRKRVS
jgi:hypothetical protein